MSSAEAYYRFETTGGCLIISLLPELNDKQWADIEMVGTEIIGRLSSAASPRLMLDLTPLNYMGSAMVALIVRLYKSVNGSGGQMVVVNTHELVNEVLKLAGLTKLWTIVDSRPKAFSALGVKSRALADPDAAPNGGNALLIAGVVGAVGAIVGLALEFAAPSAVPLKAAKLIEVAFAALGIIVGTMLLAKQIGMRRNVGIGLLAVSVLVVLGGIALVPDRRTAATTAPNPAPTTTAPAPAESPSVTPPKAVAK